MSPQLHETRMGMKFFEHTMPKLVISVEEAATHLEALTKILKIVAEEMQNQTARESEKTRLQALAKEEEMHA